jgi:hypothetical protein
MNIYLLLGLAAVSFIAGWTVNGWKEDAAKVAAIAAVEKAREAFAGENGALAERLEGKLANLKIVNRTINTEVQREIHKEPVYLNADCAIPAGGVRLLNAARGHAAGPPAGERDGAVPAAPAAGAGKPPAR